MKFTFPTKNKIRKMSFKVQIFIADMHVAAIKVLSKSKITRQDVTNELATI